MGVKRNVHIPPCADADTLALSSSELRWLEFPMSNCGGVSGVSSECQAAHVPGQTRRGASSRARSTWRPR